MRSKFVLGLVLAVGMAGVAPSLAAFLEVPYEYPTIGAACHAAVSGDTVGVFPGDYVERYAPIFAGVTVLGIADDSTLVRVDPMIDGDPLFAPQAGELPAVVENMQLGATWPGGAIENYGADAVLRRCQLLWVGGSGQTAYFIKSWEGNATITRSHIDFGEFLHVDQYVFYPNDAGHFVVEDCVIQMGSNWDLKVGGWDADGTVYEFTNNTIPGELFVGEFEPQYHYSLYLVNNIINRVLCWPPFAPDTLEWRYNCFIEEDPPPDCGYQIGNFVADPLFCEPAAGDYRLQPESPCIGAGEHGENVGARLGICWPVSVEKAPGLVASGPTWRLWPNPTTTGVWIRLDAGTSQPSLTSIEIFDVTGKLVRVLGPGDWESNGIACWDGRLGTGKDAPGGVYHVRVGRAGQETTRGLIIVR